MTPNKTPDTKHWYDAETRAQKWRRLTPLGLLANLATNFVGIGLIGYFGSIVINDMQKAIDLNRQSIEQVRSEIMCQTKQIYSCCGERANISC